MARTFLLLFLCGFYLGKSQTVSNGDFAGGSASWGCSAEINSENVYGGGTSNAVAEVDAQAGLCQVISGFTIGSVYKFFIDYSRRTGGCPGPNPAGATITLSGGSLSASVSSSVGSYVLQNSVFTFTANQTTLTLNIAANFTGTTCGLIIDNVSIVLYSGLPIELLYFKANAKASYDELEWATATQTNNDFFTIERSLDAIHWDAMETIKGEGTYLQTKYYTKQLNEILNGIYYYRLKQTDYNKKFEYSSTVSVQRDLQNLIIYPNPFNSELFINYNGDLTIDASLINALGEEIRLDYYKLDESVRFNVSGLSKGLYTLRIALGNLILYKHVVLDKSN